MILTLNQFKKWLEEKANLIYVNSGSVVGFDYEWFVSVDISQAVDSEQVKSEMGTYYKSSDTIRGYELWIDIREDRINNTVTKVYFILQNLYDKTEQVIKEFTPEYLEQHLVDNSIEDFIFNHMVKFQIVAR